MDRENLSASDEEVIEISSISSSPESTPNFDVQVTLQVIHSEAKSITFTSKSTDVAVKRKRKPRAFKRPKNWRSERKFPRIPRTDPRRELPIMLLNCLNYRDPILLASFMKRYCLPDIAYQTCELNFNPVDHDALIPRFVSDFGDLKVVNGVEAMISMVWMTLAEVPDVVLSMDNIQLTQSTQFRGTRMTADITFKGTNLFHIAKNKDVLQFFLHEHDHFQPKDYEDIANMVGILRYFALPFEMKGIFRVFLEEETHLAYRFDFIPQNIVITQPYRVKIDLSQKISTNLFNETFANTMGGMLGNLFK